MVREATQNALAVPTGAPEDYNIAEQRDPEESWRRVALRMSWVIRAGEAQALLASLPLLREKEPHPDEQPPKNLKKVHSITRDELFSRTPLPDSNSLRNPLTKDECSHRFIHARGGKSFWFACASCPSRWPRTDAMEILAYGDGAEEAAARRR